MKTFYPSLLFCLKHYPKGQLPRDIIAGVIVAIIALPLSIALAIASGVGPAVGLYTAIVAGFLAALLGGSPVQISGPTAAFATIVAGIVATKGIDGLMLATIMAGILLVLMGILKLGGLIKYIPYTITTGFTSGIAVTILIGQLKDFFGLTFSHSPVETMEKLMEVIKSFSTFNVWALVVGGISLLILIVLPKFLPKVPASLIAVIVCALLVELCDIPVNTIGVLYPDITSAPPKFTLPAGISWDKLVSVIPDAFTIAVLAAVESLLSCVVADGMVGSRHNSNTELIAQGVGNIGSALFGGIPATGAIARTAANIKNGGRSPISGMVHAAVLLTMLVVLMPYAKLIPMPTIAAILFVVAYNMSEWREFLSIVKTSPKSDTVVLVVTFVLTVVLDLVYAIVVGIILATILFMKRMSDETSVRGWEEARPRPDPDHIRFKVIPEDTASLQGQSLLVASILKPLGIKDPLGNSTVVRHPMFGNDNGTKSVSDDTITLGNKVVPGTAIIQLESTQDELIDSTGETLKNLRKRMYTTPAAYILIHCGGRRLGIGNRIDEVHKQLLREAKGVPFITCFTFGEYGYDEHSANMCGGLMLSFTAFGKN